MGGRAMRCAFALVLAALAAPAVAADATHDETEALGRRLFENHCGICHTRPALTAGLYGPELSRETAGGREDVVRGVIADGTPRMPGFKFMFDTIQIAAIAAYLKTMPPGTQAMTVPAR